GHSPRGRNSWPKGGGRPSWSAPTAIRPYTRGNQPRKSRSSHWRATCIERGPRGSDRGPPEKDLCEQVPRGRPTGVAELACVYDAAPVPRTPADIITPPGQERKDRARRPRAAGKWLTASVADDTPAVIAAAFDEAERRDCGHRRPWTALVDGNRTQIEAIEAEAGRRDVTVTVICDFVHVLEYTWKAAWSFFDKGDPDAETWVATQAARILEGKAAQ